MAVLIVLLVGILVVVVIGGVLLGQHPDQPTATPPQTSTMNPRPPTPRPSTPQPSPPQPSTPQPSPPQPSPPQPRPSTTEPSTQSPTRTEPTTEPTATPPTTTPPTTTKPTPAAKPTPKPTKRPSQPKTPEDYLVRNPLYDQTIPRSDCSQPPRPLPTTKKTDQRYLKNLVGCMLAAYGSSLEVAGFTLTQPDVVIYSGTVETPCGQGLRGYPVFYCGANETVYSSAGSTAEYGETLRLGGYWIVFHEFAHHVQQRIGVLEAAYSLDEDQLQISRRIELQADCYMGITSSSVRSVKLTKADRAEMVDWRTQVADKIHGKSASQLFWVQRGFDAADVAACSTWRATKHIG